MALGMKGKFFSIFQKSSIVSSYWLRKFSTENSKVKVLISQTHDPFFNLATEEWIFRQGDLSKHTLFLWRNAPTVVIGRNQNPWKECHVQQMEKDNVFLARRTSGGGAVFQDLGNTNFTFLNNLSSHDKNSNSKIIIKALDRFGIKAETSGRNDILVNGMKISGSAYKLSGMRAFHHGTLLINVNMGALQNYLNSKGIESVRARVVNLKELNPNITHENLSEALIEEFFIYYKDKCEITYLDNEFLKKQEYLNKVYEEYKDWNFRFGETPSFEHNLEHKFDWGLMDVYLSSEDGKIKEIKVFSDSLYPAKDSAILLDTNLSAKTAMIEEIRVALTGAKYDREGVALALNSASQKLLESEETKDASKYVQVQNFSRFFLNWKEFKEWLINAM